VKIGIVGYETVNPFAMLLRIFGTQMPAVTLIQ
jgi:hypothetical protein